MARLLAALCFFSVALGALAQERVLDTADGRSIRYHVIEEGSSGALHSAIPAARQLVGLLAAGRIDEAAALSNAPDRRAEVLRDYRASVGEEEFRRVFGQFQRAQNRITAEIAIGPRRLVIWELGEAEHHLAAQYFVEADGKFVLDDVPSDGRADLRRVLQAYRKDRAASSSTQKD